MVDAIKALLAEDTEGTRVVLNPEDIAIEGEASEEVGVGEADRLKALGQYRISVRVKGMDALLHRDVIIQAQEVDI